MGSTTQKFILITTVTLMVLLVIGNFVLNHVEPTSNYSLNTSNQPTLGNPNAKVEVIVFEEPICPDCKKYNEYIFPKIKKDFIDTDKIKYTVIPVSFIDGSMPAAEALLCTYYQDDNASSDKQFFAFLHYMYVNQPKDSDDWTSYDTLLEMAKKADSTINLDRIKKCMERHVYHTRIMQNTAEGNRVTRGNLITPAIFVNGVKLKISNKNADKILEAIEEALKDTN